MGCSPCGQSLNYEQSPIFRVQIGIKEVRAKRRKIKNLQRKGNIKNKIQIFENVYRERDTLTTCDIDLINKTLKEHFLFRRLGDQQRLELIYEMVCYSALENSYLFKQGDPASLFFIIRQGLIGVQTNHEVTKIMGKGQSFGQLALLYLAPRSASIKILKQSKFWCLSETQFKKKMESMIVGNYRISRKIIQNLGIFAILSKKQKDSLAYNMNHLKYDLGDIIFKQGDTSNSFYIIKSGSIQIKFSTKSPIVLKAGNTFGESSFQFEEPRVGTAICLGEVECLSIGKNKIRDCIGKQVGILRIYNTLIWPLLRSPFFKNLTNLMVNKILQRIQMVNYCQGETIMEAGEEINKLIICVEGEIEGYDLQNLINENCLERRRLDNSIVMSQQGLVGFIQFKVIEEILSQSSQHNIVILQNKNRKSMKATYQKINKVKICLQNYEVLRKIGDGRFASVYEVHNIIDSQKYALKCIEKNKIIKNQIQHLPFLEKQIFNLIDSPFIVKLYGTSKDQHYLYLLLQMIQGPDFFDILRQVGCFNSALCRFFLSCLILAFSDFHSLNIVYRDLKPENLVSDSNGYLKVIDLGCAKLLKQQQGFRTFTIVGTPHYMAPQIIQGKGYSFSCDIWSIGVVFYEMVFGWMPYGEGIEDPYQIFIEIQKKQLSFPIGSTDQQTILLSKRLLQKNPQIRSDQNFQAIKNFPFFNGFDWQKLKVRQMLSPYSPSRIKKQDSSFTLNGFLEGQKLKLSKPMMSKIEKWDLYF